jgi:hypothetical protein
MARGSAAEFDGNGDTPGSGDRNDPDVLRADRKTPRSPLQGCPPDKANEMNAV